MPECCFDHLHIYSHNPAKTAEFYQKVFGAKQVSKRELANGRVIINMNLCGATLLIASPMNDSVRIGLDHFGIRTDNLEEAVAELKGKGVKFTQEITEINPKLKISFLIGAENESIELQEGII